MWKLIDLKLNLVENPEGKWSNGYTIKDGQVYDHETETWNELLTNKIKKKDNWSGVYYDIYGSK
jgi:hypothetical protein